MRQSQNYVNFNFRVLSFESGSELVVIVRQFMKISGLVEVDIFLLVFFAFRNEPLTLSSEEVFIIGHKA